MILLAVIVIKPCFIWFLAPPDRHDSKNCMNFGYGKTPRNGNNQLTRENSKPKSQPPVEGNPQLAPAPVYAPIKTEPFWNRDWQGNPNYTQQICGCFCYSYFWDHTFVIHGPGDSRQTHIHQSILTPPESPGEFQNPKSLGRVTQQSLKKYSKNLHALANTWNASRVGQHLTQTNVL